MNTYSDHYYWLSLRNLFHRTRRRNRTNNIAFRVFSTEAGIMRATREKTPSSTYLNRKRPVRTYAGTQLDLNI